MPAVGCVLRNLLRSNCRLSTTPARSFASSEQVQPRHSFTHFFESWSSAQQRSIVPRASSRPFSFSHPFSPAARPIIACSSAPHITCIAVPCYPSQRRGQNLRNSITRRVHTSSSATVSSNTMTNNGDSRSKRKQPPTPTNDRPMKQIKSESSEYQNGSEPGTSVDMPMDMDDARTMNRAATTADSAEWQNTVQKVIKNVVSIHFCQTSSFDTDPAVASEATGFVVDAEKGYILTNRVSCC
jgi:hypothetical protein